MGRDFSSFPFFFFLLPTSVTNGFGRLLVDSGIGSPELIEVRIICPEHLIHKKEKKNIRIDVNIVDDLFVQQYRNTVVRTWSPNMIRHP